MGEEGWETRDVSGHADATHLAKKYCSGENSCAVVVIATTPLTTYNRRCDGFREFDGRMGRDDSRDVRCLWLS